jgi:hypothetical protein
MSFAIDSQLYLVELDSLCISHFKLYIVHYRPLTIRTGE